MPFYLPKSQVKTNLYTNGGEYMVASTSNPYIGYYYETSKGEKFVGKIPNTRSSVLIISITNPNNPVLDTLQRTEVIEFRPNYDSADEEYSPNSMVNNDTYRSLTNSKNQIETRFLPQQTYSYPTEEELKIGSYTKYFSKRTNGYIYIEISKDSYTKFKNKDSKVAWELYECISTPWYVGSNNYLNKVLIKDIEEKYNWLGFSNFFGTGPQQNYNNSSPKRIKGFSSQTTVSSGNAKIATNSGRAQNTTSGGGSGY